MIEICIFIQYKHYYIIRKSGTNPRGTITNLLTIFEKSNDLLSIIY